MAKKRANGEGSIRRKPNGRWEGRYTLGIDPATGRAIQKSVSAKTRAECKEKLERAIRDNRGIPMDHNEDYTVAEWCRLWFETYSKPVIRPNTAKNYRNIIENHIVPAIGMVKLKRLTAIQIQQMYNNSKARGGYSGLIRRPTRPCPAVRCAASTWCCPRRSSRRSRSGSSPTTPATTAASRAKSTGR